ncbi:hypothetical protein AAFF_G00294810 [Aldrovandia affinis]|uniref:WxxW domain-containing protein n=1 Tax=Aldrovandia affinis TaxID=143900 RepID=A0AAD7R9F1_9TELE|nr:hypothetical protein AAFF_G00294810 [Aldrovandia affinis]
MFTCSGRFCSDCRTRWFDLDDPTGNGDYEVLSMLLTAHPRHICPQPIAIEAQTLSGDPASSTGDTFLIYDATNGFACVNTDQRTRKCNDYRVRFTCPTEFCSVATECRTRWLSSDDPADEGDVESIPQLLHTFPGQLCRNPISIAAQTRSGIPAQHTGDTFLSLLKVTSIALLPSYDITFGFVCINSEQRKGRCKNYQVMLTCPSDFCRGCRTRWLDADNPTGQGDYETLLQLQMRYPGEICSQPIGIEAITVSGTPALQTGDTFLIYDATNGFACLNTAQRGRMCQDYKVRFTCPLEFCAQKPNPVHTVLNVAGLLDVYTRRTNNSCCSFHKLLCCGETEATMIMLSPSSDFFQRAKKLFLSEKASQVQLKEFARKNAANALSVTNMVMGLASILCSLNGHQYAACWLVLIGYLLDLADGAVARQLGACSALGAKLDDFADFTTFGIATALLLRTHGLMDNILCMCYAMAVFTRLCFFSSGIPFMYRGLPCIYSSAILACVSLLTGGNMLVLRVTAVAMILFMVNQGFYPHDRVLESQAWKKAVYAGGVAMVFCSSFPPACVYYLLWPAEGPFLVY